ncbi:transposase IS116/IS110/IS902 family protein [Burkholderia sp. BT03]|nr:transposase IS116/IS110/IS902 family protein [Burkholderia sp. BT03]SKC49038.1 Transposase IS116/IS110/IS902 family protein [Paraburkholderia hospita]
MRPRFELKTLKRTLKFALNLHNAKNQRQASHNWSRAVSIRVYFSSLLGLLRAAWRPGDEVCVVRAVVRQREVLLAEQASWVLRMQKALVQMNLQLTEVLTDVMGTTGQAIVRAIVSGERDPKALASHRHGRGKASAAEIERALTGNYMARGARVRARPGAAMFDSLAQRIRECDAKIEALLIPLGRHEMELAGPGKRLGKNTPRFDARAALARWAGVDLTRINGLSVTTVMTILSESGPDLSRFASVKHFCSWLGLCPGTKISGGKVLSARTRRSTNRVGQGPEARRDEPLTQRLGARRVLAPDVRAHGQAARQYRRRPQAGAHGVLHARARRGLRRPGAAALRGTAARTQHRRAQASRVKPALFLMFLRSSLRALRAQPEQLCGGCGRGRGCTRCQQPQKSSDSRYEDERGYA